MNPNTLEQLMIDRAMGELSPDTEELLDAYLEEHPDSRTALEEIANTVRLTEQALAPQVSDLPLPPFSRPAVPVDGRSLSPLQWLRLAACLVVGLGVGILIQSKPQLKSEGAGTPPSAPQTASTASVAAAAASFWSYAPPSRALSDGMGKPSHRLIRKGFFQFALKGEHNG